MVSGRITIRTIRVSTTIAHAHGRPIDERATRGQRRGCSRSGEELARVHLVVLEDRLVAGKSTPPPSTGSKRSSRQRRGRARAARRTPAGRRGRIASSPAVLAAPARERAQEQAVRVDREGDDVFYAAAVPRQTEDFVEDVWSARGSCGSRTASVRPGRAMSTLLWLLRKPACSNLLEGRRAGGALQPGSPRRPHRAGGRPRARDAAPAPRGPLPRAETRRGRRNPRRELPAPCDRDRCRSRGSGRGDAGGLLDAERRFRSFRRGGVSRIVPARVRRHPVSCNRACASRGVTSGWFVRFTKDECLENCCIGVPVTSIQERRLPPSMRSSRTIRIHRREGA